VVQGGFERADLTADRPPPLPGRVEFLTGPGGVRLQELDAIPDAPGGGIRLPSDFIGLSAQLGETPLGHRRGRLVVPGT
jgi:hypothetical protein